MRGGAAAGAPGWSRSLEPVPDSASLLAAGAALCSSDSGSDGQSDKSELLSVWVTRARRAPVGTRIGDPWLNGPGEPAGNFPFLPLVKTGLPAVSGLVLAALGSVPACWGGFAGFFAAADLVLLLTVAGFSLDPAVLRLELRFWWAKDTGAHCCCCCLESLGDLGPMAGGLAERDGTSFRKGLAGDGARFGLFFSGCWLCALVSPPEPLELSIIHRRERSGGGSDQFAAPQKSCPVSLLPSSPGCASCGLRGLLHSIPAAVTP